jgi:hypothetical protein
VIYLGTISEFIAHSIAAFLGAGVGRRKAKTPAKKTTKRASLRTPKRRTPAADDSIMAGAGSAQRRGYHLGEPTVNWTSNYCRAEEVSGRSTLAVTGNSMRLLSQRSVSAKAAIRRG